MSLFSGSGVAIITPFRHGAVDYTAFTRLIELQLASGTDAIVVCGTTGEASTMSMEEKMDVIRFAVDRVAGRIPVIAGTGGNNTAAVIEQSRTAEAIGVDGLLIVTPYYNKTTQDGLVAHYAAVDEQVHTPILVYNVPSRTGLNVLPETMKRLMTLEHVIGIKEASGNIDQVVHIAEICPNCDIYSGNDNEVVPIMALGGIGVISTIANVVPEEMHQLCVSMMQGDTKKALEIQLSLMPIFRAAFCEVNPIPIKTMMGMLKLCRSEMRLPLVPANKEHKLQIKQALMDFGLMEQA